MINVIQNYPFSCLLIHLAIGFFICVYPFIYLFPCAPYLVLCPHLLNRPSPLPPISTCNSVTKTWPCLRRNHRRPKASIISRHRLKRARNNGGGLASILSAKTFSSFSPIFRGRSNSTTTRKNSFSLYSTACCIGPSALRLTPAILCPRCRRIRCFLRKDSF